MHLCSPQLNRKTAAPSRDGGSLFCCSKPVSRVLSFKTAIYLDAPLLTRSSRLPGTAGPACMSLHGVAPDRVYIDGRFHTPSGELLPRLSTLTSTQERGSPAAHTHLKTGEAVYLCCTCPRVAPGGCYPLSLPCGARTFLTGGPFAPPARLSSLLQGVSYRKMDRMSNARKNFLLRVEYFFGMC